MTERRRAETRQPHYLKTRLARWLKDNEIVITLDVLFISLVGLTVLVGALIWTVAR